MLLAGWPSPRCCCRRASTCSLNEIAILALFALSLDLILGYAGIVSLGHAAFFGVGAYAAALFAKHVMPDPLVGLAVGDRGRRGRWASLTSFTGAARQRPDAPDGDARRGADAAASSPTSLTGSTGGADGLQGVVMGPLLGQLRVRPRPAAPPMPTASSTLFVLFLLARRHRAFAVRPVAEGDPRQPRCAPRRIGVPVDSRLVAVYTLAAAYAGAAGALLAQTTGFASLDVFEFHRSADVLLVLVIGGTGWLYGGIVGAIVFKLLQDALSST